MKKVFLFIFLFLILISLVNAATVGSDKGKGVIVTPPKVTTTSSNVTVNSSNYWDDMNTINSTQMQNNGGVLNILESWLRGIITGYSYLTTELEPAWNGNYSIFTGLINNQSYLSTYNSSYAGSLNNWSYLSTYNATYEGSVNNASYLSTSNSTYDSYSTFNTTKNIQVLANNSINYSYYSGVAYDLVNTSFTSDNRSWNETYANSLFAKNTTLAIQYLVNNSINYSYYSGYAYLGNFPANTTYAIQQLINNSINYSYYSGIALNVNNSFNETYANGLYGIWQNGTWVQLKNGMSNQVNISNIMFVNGSSVGIGTSTPANKLDVRGAGGDLISIGGGAAVTLKLGFESTGGNPYIDGANTGRLEIKTSGVERMRIDENGKVGIGTTAPAEKLEVNGSAIVGGSLYLPNGERIYFKDSAGTYRTAFTFNSANSTIIRGGAGGIEFQDSGGNSLLTSAGNGVWTFKDTTASTGVTTFGIRAGAGQGSSDLFNIADSSGTTSYLKVNSAGSVGIGTTTPSQLLDVRGKGNFSGTVYINNNTQVIGNNQGTAGYISQFQNNNTINNSVIYQNGSNIGIGTTAPAAALDIQTASLVTARIKSTVSTANSLIYLENDAGEFAQFLMGRSASAAAGELYMYSANNRNIHLYPLGTGNTLFDTGNVGIGTTAPSQTLDVRGIINSSGIIYFNNNTPVIGGNGGATAYVPVWQDDGRTLNNSNIYQNGTNIGINTANPRTYLQVNSLTSADSSGAVVSSTAGFIGTYNAGSITGATIYVGSRNALAINTGAGITFGGNSGDNRTYPFGIIKGFKETGGSDYAGYMSFYTTQADSNIIERIRINSTGSVGIGTTTPKGRLSVIEPASPARLIIGVAASETPNSTAELSFEPAAGFVADPTVSPRIYTITDGGYNTDMIFDTYVGGSGRKTNVLVLKNTGNVGIGTTTPSKTLDVRGVGNFSGTVYINNKTDLSQSANYQFTTNNFNGSGNFTTTGILNANSASIGSGGILVNDSLSALTIQREGEVQFNFKSYGGGGSGNTFAATRAEDTIASPSAIKKDDVIFNIQGNGYYDSSSISTGNNIYFSATENWAIGTKGTNSVFRIIPTGTSTLTEVMRLENYSVIGLNLVSKNNLSVNGNTNITKNLVVDGNFTAKRSYYYGYDNSTQLFGNVANTQVINISNNNDVNAWQIAVENRQNVTFETKGEYLISFSPEFFQNSGSSALVTFWMQKTDDAGLVFSDVLWSNSRFTVPNNGYNAPTIEFPVEINDTREKVRFMWWSDSTSTQIYSSGVLTSPSRPSIPGVLLNIRKNSALT